MEVLNKTLTTKILSPSFNTKLRKMSKAATSNKTATDVVQKLNYKISQLIFKASFKAQFKITLVCLLPLLQLGISHRTFLSMKGFLTIRFILFWMREKKKERTHLSAQFALFLSHTAQAMRQSNLILWLYQRRSSNTLKRRKLKKVKMKKSW